VVGEEEAFARAQPAHRVRHQYLVAVRLGRDTKSRIRKASSESIPPSPAASSPII
jgi:hypothetical protein